MIDFASTAPNLSDSRTVPTVASNPSAFLNMTTPSPALSTCNLESSAPVNGSLPLAVNADGSANTCLTPAPAGSTVTMFLNGVGVTSPPVVTASGATVVSVSALPAAVLGLWQVTLQIPAGTPSGGNQIALTAGGVAVGDPNLVVWVR